MLTVQRKAGGVGCYAWREDASGRRLHEPGLCAAHRDWYGREKLNRSGAPTACVAGSLETSPCIFYHSLSCKKRHEYSYSIRNNVQPPIKDARPFIAFPYTDSYLRQTFIKFLEYTRFTP